MVSLRRLSLLLLVLSISPVAACAAPDAADVRTSTSADSTGSTDPLAHLQVIASPDMQGRGTPSTGLDRAIAYVVGECTHAGLVGGVGDGVYEQPFTVGGGQTNNVVGLLPGTGAHEDEIVLLSAHLDHLGAGYPGADDNGSGSAALLAIANGLSGTRGSHPLDRTVAFLWTTGEERGLLGSAYFTDHPPARVPLTKIAQVINLDAVGALEDTRFSFLPDDTAATRNSVTLMNQANAEMERPFARINQDLQAYARRTDGYSFVRHHVPTIWVFEGLTNPDGGGSLMPRYHQPTDTIENLVAENGGSKLRRMTTMLVGTIEKIANSQ